MYKVSLDHLQQLQWSIYSHRYSSRDVMPIGFHKAEIAHILLLKDAS